MCRHDRHSDLTDRLDAIERTLGEVMSGLTDLTANISTLQSEWLTFLADLTAILANTAGDSDAAVEAAAQLVAQQTAAIQAEDLVINPPVVPPTA